MGPGHLENNPKCLISHGLSKKGPEDVFLTK